MPYRLYLDDVRNPRDTYKTTSNSEWVVARSYDEFVRIITRDGLPFQISFDHDIDDSHYLPETDPKTYTEKTGHDCAKWLVEYCIDHDVNLPVWHVHSMNPIGASNIKSLLNCYAKHRKTT